MFTKQFFGVAAVFTVWIVATGIRAFPQALYWVGSLGGNASEGIGVSAAGKVVGRALNAAGQWRAFCWDPINGIQDLGVLPGGNRSIAWAISTDGMTIVGASQNHLGQERAVRWTATGIQDLGTLGGSRSTATAVSADGSWIIGWALTSTNTTHAFRWSSEIGMQSIGTLGGAASIAKGVSGDGKVVVGVSNLPPPLNWQRAFRWDTVTGMQNLHTLGGTVSEATAVSHNGEVVVGNSYQDNIRSWRAFRYVASQGMQPLAMLPNFLGSQVYSVSCDGRIAVGIMYNQAEEPIAVRWSTSGAENLNLSYAALLTDGSVLLTARAISYDGRYIVGTGYNARTGRSEAYLLDTGASCSPHNGDVNLDGCVDDADFIAVLFAFGQGGCSLGRVDVTCDGTVDDEDLLRLALHFGDGC